MKSETIIHHHPPTPPSVSTELQSGLHHVAQFNAEGSFSYDHLHSHGAGYGTPGAVIQEGLSQHSSHPDNTPGADYGLGIHYVNDLSQGKMDVGLHLTRTTTAKGPDTIPIHISVACQ